MKGLLKILAIALTLSALFAANAAAQCSGKTVYLEVPSGWYTNNTVYYLVDGEQSINATKNGNWLVFTFVNFQNDGNGKDFAFFRTSGQLDNGSYWISKAGYNQSRTSRPGNSDKFKCDATTFGSGNVVYIYPNPTNPTQTRFDTSPPNAYYFYFLPPRDKEWIKSTSYLAYPMSGVNALEALGVDPGKCGWYRKIFFNESPKDEPTFIYQGRNKSNQIGLYGIAEDPDEWKGGSPEPFNLKEKFDALLGTNTPGSIYFVADQGSLDGTGGWHIIDPNIVQQERCNYEMAAIIYDTHSSVNSSFFVGGTSQTGISKNIPANTLLMNNAGIPKMQWGGKSNNLDSWNQQNFIDAFKCSPGKNAMRCYDMPFTRDASGSWTFDSNKLCNDGSVDIDGTCSSHGGYMGGFFVPELQNRPYTNLNDSCAYSSPLGNNYSCSSCDTYVSVTGGDGYFVEFNNTVDKYCFDRGRMGNSPNCGAEYGEGSFLNGDNPAIWDWGGRPSGFSTSKNELFCFETHATFTYEPGQEFFFRGDDDIWVFMNNKLVIDLGGTHLAAPGYVNLQNRAAELGFVPGGEYPLDIFFCDRRTAMSNVRISTNMYIAQESGLFVKTGNGTDVPAQVCLKQTEGGSCLAMTGSGSGETEKCGAEVGSILDYYIVNIQKTDSTELNSSNGECYTSGPELICYGGIRINTQTGSVRVIVSEVYGFVGTQIIKAKIREDYVINPRPDPVEVARFAKRTTLKMAWGNIRNISGATLSSACKENNNTVAGELVPVCIADGEWDNTGKTSFTINAEGSTSQSFRFTPAGIKDEDKKAELKIYRDALGTDPVTEQNPTFTVPANSFLTLWVSGGFYMDTTEYTYEINVQGSREAPAKLTAYHPSLKWVKNDDSTAAIAPGTPQIAGENKGSARDNLGNLTWVFTGEDIKLSLVAYDSLGTPGNICKTCDFGLNHQAVACKNGKPGSATGCADGDGPFPETDNNLITLNGGVEKGVAHIDIQGQVEVVEDDYARLTVRGPSAKGPSIFWDSLQFKEPPVPRPVNAELYDKDGDGRGDSLVIAYNRGFDKDSLPSKIEVFWGTDTLRFGIGNYNPDSGKFFPPSSKADNLDFWKKHIINRANGSKSIEQRTQGIDKEGTRDTIVITKEDIKALNSTDTAFSEAVRTHGKGSIKNWASFEFDNKQYTLGFSTSIKDKMPAIVISARYIAGTDGGCPSDAVPCRDQLALEFSEPVYKTNSDNLNDISLFGYKLMSKNWDKFDTLKNLYPYQVRSARWLGDSTAANFVFQNTGASDSPLPSDWVRFFSGLAAVTDSAGNLPNPNEQGCEIIGRSRFIPDKVAIGTASPGNDNLERSIQDVFDSLGIKARAKDLFVKSRPIEFLPVPKGWTARNAGDKYGGTVGMVFLPDVYSTLNELELDNVPDEAITFHARAFYHTNLGDFVVNRELPVIRCDSDIFPPGPNGKPSCRKDEEGRARNTGVYVAWNLKDSKARWVGTGAYVGLHDFRWEVNYDGKDTSGKNINIHESFDKVNRQVEMFGVRRVNSRK